MSGREIAVTGGTGSTRSGSTRSGGSSLSIAHDQDSFTPEQVDALKSMNGWRNVPDAELSMFFHQAKRSGLDPFCIILKVAGPTMRQTFRPQTKPLGRFRMNDDNAVLLKHCSRCDQTFPYTKEYFHSAGKGKLVSQCKPCKREIASKYYYDNHEKQLAKNAEWREKNRVKYRAYFREYGEKNREKRKQQSKEYYWGNVEESRRRGRERYRANKPEYVERAKRWAKANPEKAEAQQRNKRMRRRGAPLDDEAKVYVELIRKDVCSYCGKSPDPFELDHIVPLSAGGKSDWENLAPACRRCNAAKANKDLLTFLLRLQEIESVV